MIGIGLANANSLLSLHTGGFDTGIRAVVPRQLSSVGLRLRRLSVLSPFNWCQPERTWLVDEMGPRFRLRASRIVVQGPQ